MILIKKAFNKIRNKITLDEINAYDPYQFKIGSLLFSQIKSDNKEPTQLKQIDLNEITKPL